MLHLQSSSTTDEDEESTKAAKAGDEGRRGTQVDWPNLTVFLYIYQTTAAVDINAAVSSSLIFINQSILLDRFAISPAA